MIEKAFVRTGFLLAKDGTDDCKMAIQGWPAHPFPAYRFRKEINQPKMKFFGVQMRVLLGQARVRIAARNLFFGAHARALLARARARIAARCALEEQDVV